MFAILTWPEAVLGCVVAISLMIFLGVLYTGKWSWDRN